MFIIGKLFLTERLILHNISTISCNWNTVRCAIQDLPWHNIWSADYPGKVLNKHFLLLVGRFVPTKVIRVSNKDKT